MGTCCPTFLPLSYIALFSLCFFFIIFFTNFSKMMSTIDSGFDSGSSPELHATSLEDPPMSRTRLFSHLSNCMQALESMPPSVLSMAVPTQQGPMSPPHSVSPPLYSSNTAYHQHAVKPTPAIEPASTNNNNNFRVKSESLSAAINSPPPTSMMRLKNEDQVVPLDLMTKVGKENQAQDLTMSTLKSRQPLSNVNTVENDILDGKNNFIVYCFF